MKPNFKDNIKDNINNQETPKNESSEIKDFTPSNDTNSTFVLKKKVDDKKGKKVFNVYMDPELLKELDKLAKRTNWSRNELVNMMCQHCINNLKIDEE